MNKYKQGKIKYSDCGEVSPLFKKTNIGRRLEIYFPVFLAKAVFLYFFKNLKLKNKRKILMELFYFLRFLKTLKDMSKM